MSDANTNSDGDGDGDGEPTAGGTPPSPRPPTLPDASFHPQAHYLPPLSRVIRDALESQSQSPFSIDAAVSADDDDDDDMQTLRQAGHEPSSRQDTPLMPPPRYTPSRAHSTTSTVDLDTRSDLVAIPSLPPPSAAGSSRAGKRRADEASSSSPTKRSRKSSSTGFRAAVKDKLEQLYGASCWHCRGMMPQMVHAFAKADAAFTECRLLGLVDLDHVDDADNALSLCPSCHYALDRDTPLLIVVPQDLQFFIAVEQHWQRDFAPHGYPRPALTASYQAHCGGQYDCYMVNYFLGKFEEDGEQNIHRPPYHTRTWHGDPKAIIWRARKKILSIPSLPEHMDRVQEQLLTLAHLYEKGNRLLRNYRTSLPSPSDPRRDNDANPIHDLTGTRRSNISDPARDPQDTWPTSQTASQPHYNSNSPHRACLFSSSSAPVKLLDSAASTRKRARESSTRLPTPTPTVGETEEDVPRKRLKLELTSPMVLSPTKHSQSMNQSPPRFPWRWGGPERTTEQTVEYWNKVFSFLRKPRQNHSIKELG